MTLKELQKLCIDNGFKCIYGNLKEVISLPYLVITSEESTNFSADDKAFFTKTPVELEYTYKDKNLNDQNKIENNILKDFSWRKSDETYLSNERVWQVSYFFEIF